MADDKQRVGDMAAAMKATRYVFRKITVSDANELGPATATIWVGPTLKEAYTPVSVTFDREKESILDVLERLTAEAVQTAKALYARSNAVSNTADDTESLPTGLPATNLQLEADIQEARNGSK